MLLKSLVYMRSWILAIWLRIKKPHVPAFNAIKSSRLLSALLFLQSLVLFIAVYIAQGAIEIGLHRYQEATGSFIRIFSRDDRSHFKMLQDLQDLTGWVLCAAFLFLLLFLWSFFAPHSFYNVVKKCKLL